MSKITLIIDGRKYETSLDDEVWNRQEEIRKRLLLRGGEPGGFPLVDVVPLVDGGSVLVHWGRVTTVEVKARD